MPVAGIDIGNQTGKIVILSDDGEVLAKQVLATTEEASSTAKEALARALAKAGLAESDLRSIVATGAGRSGVRAARRTLSEVTCDGRGAAHLIPSARTVIDIGGEVARGLRCAPGGNVLDFVTNDKCASGAGVFIEAMAQALEIPLAQMSELSRQSTRQIDIDATCAVFAESEVVSLIHRQVPRADIARGIHEAIAVRTAAMLRRISILEDVVLVGGTAANGALVESLSCRIGKRVLVPADPVTVGALGAALFALDTERT